EMQYSRLTLAITLMSHITPIRATEGVVIVFAREPTLEVIILKQAGLASEVLMNNLLDGSHPRHCEWLAVTIPDFMHTLISEGGRDNCIPTDWPQMSGIDTHPYLYILVFDVDDGAPFSRLSVGRTSCPSLPVFEGMTHTVRTSSLSSQWGFKGGMTAIVPFLLVKGTMAWKVIVTLVQAAGAAEYVNNVTREMVDTYYPVLNLKASGHGRTTPPLTPAAVPVPIPILNHVPAPAAAPVLPLLLHFPMENLVRCLTKMSNNRSGNAARQVGDSDVASVVTVMQIQQAIVDAYEASPHAAQPPIRTDSASTKRLLSDMQQKAAVVVEGEMRLTTARHMDVLLPPLSPSPYVHHP
ncbi:hypothetical protein OH76DRAFT_1424261, partial [Lentinus brumalis]